MSNVGITYLGSVLLSLIIEEMILLLAEKIFVQEGACPKWLTISVSHLLLQKSETDGIAAPEHLRCLNEHEIIH